MVLPNTATCEGVSAGELHQKVALKGKAPHAPEHVKNYLCSEIISSS